MSWVFVNNTNAPVNIGIYNGSILYFHQNHVQPFSAATCKPAESVEADDWEGITLLKDAQGRTLIPDTCMANFDVYDVGYDIFITYDTPATELDSSSNWEAAENIASLTVGALLDVAGIAMIWAPGVGEAVESAGVGITAAAITNIGIATAGVGVVLTAADIASNLASVVLEPGYWRTWYGAKDYMNVINGGYTGTIVDGKITDAGTPKPLSIHWTNTGSDPQESGDAPAS